MNASTETLMVVEAVWTDETTGNPASHADPALGYYEARLPSGERITASDGYCPGALGDIWHMDDGLGGGHCIDTPEFRDAVIRFVGGPRAGEEVT